MLRVTMLQAETTDHEWMWITTLDTQAFPPKVVRDLGHERWKQENNGWNDLTQNWALKHGFLHACRHRPRAATTENQPQPADSEVTEEDSTLAPKQVEKHDQLIPNHGLAAIALILVLAFTVCAAFLHCHSKLVRLHHFSGIEVARQLRISVSKLPPRIRAPDSPAPQSSTT
jgi:hypothetical protein